MAEPCFFVVGWSGYTWLCDQKTWHFCCPGKRPRGSGQRHLPSSTYHRHTDDYKQTSSITSITYQHIVSSFLKVILLICRALPLAQQNHFDILCVDSCKVGDCDTHFFPMVSSWNPCSKIVPDLVSSQLEDYIVTSFVHFCGQWQMWPFNSDFAGSAFTTLYFTPFPSLRQR